MSQAFGLDDFATIKMRIPVDRRDLDGHRPFPTNIS
jgi:hypothetical protein